MDPCCCVWPVSVLFAVGLIRLGWQGFTPAGLDAGFGLRVRGRAGRVVGAGLIVLALPFFYPWAVVLLVIRALAAVGLWR